MLVWLVCNATTKLASTFTHVLHGIFRPRRYIPVIEDLNIELAAKRIALESELGPFRFFIKVRLGWASLWSFV